MANGSGNLKAITLSQIFVLDQNEALDFYVRNLGFEKAPGCPDGANNLFPPAVYFRWSRSSLDPTISQTKENA